MKRVYTAKDIEELKRNGGTLPADAILTPQAKEALASGSAMKRNTNGSKGQIQRLQKKSKDSSTRQKLKSSNALSLTWADARMAKITTMAMAVISA